MRYLDRVDVEASVLLLRALANPARLRIALRLLDGACAVGVLEAELGLRQPNLSQHLAELREAGLVAARREARTVVYTLAGDGQRNFLAALMGGLNGEAPSVAASRLAPPQRRQAAVFARVAAP